MTGRRGEVLTFRRAKTWPELPARFYTLHTNDGADVRIRCALCGAVVATNPQGWTAAGLDAQPCDCRGRGPK